MDLQEKVKSLKKMVTKLEEGILFVESHVIPRLETDKSILANLRQDLIKAEAELASGNISVPKVEGTEEVQEAATGLNSDATDQG